MPASAAKQIKHQPVVQRERAASVETGLNAGIPRPLEVALAASALLASSPFILLAALAVALTSHGPIVFRQKRVGRGGSLFTLYKLRTMYVSQKGPGVTSGDDARITRVGKVLRRTKIDELPELWNVIRG